MIRNPEEPADDGREAIVRRVRGHVAARQVRVTQHASQEMVAEDIALSKVFEAVASGDVLENYPEHRRGPCCLLHGRTSAGRDLHVVCTTASPMLVIITVYEPKPPKWSTPKERGRLP
ncbi:MAG: DUF4258 domain-containing protein [Phycisphaerales bacterium]|nr:DUF4258 domain-containing protein [Phycisphaerales bacterium]